MINKKWVPDFIVLVFLGLAQIFIRGHYLTMPLFTDFSVYAYMGHALREGDLLYTTLIDNKPPGIYITYMLAEKLFGYQQSTIVILGIIFSLISMVFLFLLLRQMRGMICASIGAVFWCLISSAPALHAEFPNTELFINSFVLIALWSFVKYLDNTKYWLYITGTALAIATIYKMNAVFILVALLIYLAIYSGTIKKSPIRYLTELFKLVLPTFFLWGMVYIYFVFQNRFEDMYLILFTAVRQYAGNIWMNEWVFIKSFRFLFVPALKEIWILIMLSYLWIVSVGMLKPKSSVGWLLFVFGGILAMIGSLRVSGPHYYQVLLPVVCIMSALFISQFTEQFKRQRLHSMGVIFLLAASLSILGYYQINYLKTDSDKIAVKMYGYSPADDRKLGLILKSITLPEETIYQWGLSPSIYFYSQRKAASGFLLNQIFFFAEQKYAEILY